MCLAQGGSSRCKHTSGCEKPERGNGMGSVYVGEGKCKYPGGCEKYSKRKEMCMAHVKEK